MRRVKLKHLGSWFKTYDDDARIVSLVTDFKVYYDFHTTRYVLTFPDISIEKVIYNLELNHISYELINENVIKEFESNNYDNFVNGNLPSVYYVLGKAYNRKIKGSFKAQYIGEDIVEYVIGNNIDQNALLVKKVISHNVNDIMDVNGYKVLLIEKNIE